MDNGGGCRTLGLGKIIMSTVLMVFTLLTTSTRLRQSGLLLPQPPQHLRRPLPADAQLPPELVPGDGLAVPLAVPGIRRLGRGEQLVRIGVVPDGWDEGAGLGTVSLGSGAVLPGPVSVLSGLGTVLLKAGTVPSSRGSSSRTAGVARST